MKGPRFVSVEFVKMLSLLALGRYAYVSQTRVDYWTPIQREWIISRFELICEPKVGDYPLSIYANQYHLHRLACVAPAGVGESSRYSQANGQERHDQHRTHKPAEHINRVEGAHVVHRSIQIQSRHHDDNRRHRKGDARIGELNLGQTC